MMNIRNLPLVKLSAVMLLIIGATTATANAQAINSIVMTPSSLSMYVGESKTVSLSGSPSYYIGANSNPSVASVVLNGSSLAVTGYSTGTDSVSVCSYSNGGVFCSAFIVTVMMQINTQQQSSTQQQATISFSKSDVTLNVGEVQNVTIYGSGAGAYYISGYGSDSVNAYISGNVMTLTGNKMGGSNITVCQFNGACGNVYGFVPNSAANTTATQTLSIVTPDLSAFYASSNNIGGGFLGKGATLTFKFNTSTDVANETLKVNGQVVQVMGSGSGPFGGTYVINGNESIPLSVSIDFTTSQETSGHAYFTIGDRTNTQKTPVLQSPALPAANGAGSSAGFIRTLQSGSIGADVTALQSLLKKLGVYSGPITGKFGLQTETAVKKYQANNKLKQVGVVGPATRDLLNRAN